jgi:glucokinase
MLKDKLWIGVDIGGTKTAVLGSFSPPELLGRHEFPTEPQNGPDHAITQIVEGIRSLLAKAGASAIEGIGVSCGSPLDRNAGLIQSPPNLPTWINVPITSILEKAFGVPCRLENDANAGAVAEYRFGAGRGARDMIFITMGTGFGAGIITDGRLYHGCTDSAGEIGHVRLTRTGPVGYNKAGSAEGWASGGGIAQLATRMAKAARMQGKDTALLKYLEKSDLMNAKNVAAAAHEGDHVALQVLRRAAVRLGEALAIMIDLFNPEKIIMGGIALRLGELVLAPARRVVEREALPHAAAACQILTAELGEQIGDAAALCVAVGLD